MPDKRIIAARMGNGHIGLVEQDVAPVRAGTVLVEVHSSLISPGTELGGWHGLRAELDDPKPDAQPQPFGYAHAGVVLEPGEGVEEFRPGDRVVSNGPHAEIVAVPRNLCAGIPEGVTDDDASFAVLGSVALQGLRLAKPELGEKL